MEMDILTRYFRKIKAKIWLCLGSGIITGLITHLYILTNKLPNWDDINNLHWYGQVDTVGRWMLDDLGILAGVWSVPALNGMLTILFLSIASCLIVSTLKIENEIGICLVSIIMLTFPSVASLMTFMFTANTYALGVLLGCLGVWLVTQRKYGIVGGIPLFVLTLAVYQSYICLFAGILVFSLVMDLYRKKEIKIILVKGVKYLLSLVIALLSYLWITPKIVGELSDYRGMDSMGQISLYELPHLMGRSYKRIIEYFLFSSKGYITREMALYNRLTVVMLVIVVLYLSWKGKLYRDLKRIALIAILLFLIPLALSGIYVMAPEVTQATTLMLYQYCFVYIVLIGLLEIVQEIEKNKEEKTYFYRIKSVIIGCLYLLIFVVGYDNYVLTNNAYFRMEIANKRITSFYERIYTNVEEQVGYKFGDQISLLGDYWPEKNILSSAELGMSDYEDWEGIAMENGLFTSGVRRNFLRTYLGIDYEEVDPEWENNYFVTEEFKQKPSYPAEGSIWKKDGIWVVKIND